MCIISQKELDSKDDFSKGCVIICTAISFVTSDHYFGRNLDLDRCYQESVVIVPRNFRFKFRCAEESANHYAIIGMATVVENYPLFYDATNEHGLSIAGLNFPDNANYFPVRANKDNIASFELIAWILCKCKNVKEAEKQLENLNITDMQFSKQYPQTPLHWIVSDKQQSITIESISNGLHVYQNPIGVLTNNPGFPFHLIHLTNYLNLSNDIPHNRFSEKIALIPYSLGMGAIGLPGDLSSSSRFIRAAFTKLNSFCKDDESSSVSQFFHILGSVSQTNGCCRTEMGFEKTFYSSCCNTDKGIYYYTTYENHQITAIDMNKQDLDGTTLYQFPIIRNENIFYAN